MTERVRIVEGTWSCTSCDATKILGRLKTCPHCGNPREEGKETEFDFAESRGRSSAETVTEAKLLEKAASGKDWYCAYCAAGNQGTLERCQKCQAPRESSAPSPAPKSVPPPPVVSPPGKGRMALWVFGGAALLLMGGIFWATRTHDVSGQVSEVSWRREVSIERFTRVTASGWQDELRVSAPVMPVDGKGEEPGVENIRDCSRRQRGTRQVPDGTERVCRTVTRQEQCGTEERCRTVDLGNGFAEERCQDVPRYCPKSVEQCEDRTRYRQEPVFGMECTYDTFEWMEVDRREAHGTADAPKWPEVDLGTLEKASRSEQFRVAVAYERKGNTETHLIHPRSESEFLEWRPQQNVQLTISNLGKVQRVVPR